MKIRGETVCLYFIGGHIGEFDIIHQGKTAHADPTAADEKKKKNDARVRPTHPAIV
jgi:hypothetical protein